MYFPKAADKPRLQKYAHGDKLYFGNHFEAFAIKGEQEFTERYNRLRYVTANFAGLASRVMADMLFGEKIVFDVDDKNSQLFLDGLIEDNELIAQGYESVLANSRRGDAVFKMRIGKRQDSPTAKPTIIIEEIPASIYFPVLNASTARFMPSEEQLIWQFEQNGQTYLHKEVHKPGYIFTEIYSYDPKAEKIIAELSPAQFNFEAEQKTGIEKVLVWHVPNVRDGSSYFGTSDYEDLEGLFFALNNRMTKIDNILDKHSDPILAVPPGVFDKDGKVKKKAFGMFEVDNENPGFNKPEYIVWNANLEAAFTEVDKLVDFLFMFSEISPATMGMDKSGGKAESGRALKFKLMRTIAKRNRKKIYYDIAFKKMLETSMELALANGIKIADVLPKEAVKPDINWGDGVIADITELIEQEVKRTDAGLSSRADSIARLDGISPEDAKVKVVEIDKEGVGIVPNLENKSKTQPGDTDPKPAGPIPPSNNKIPVTAATPTTGK